MSFELSTVFLGGCAMRQAVIHRPLTSEARVQSQAFVFEIVLEWHWDRFPASILVFSCKFNTKEVKSFIQI